MKIKLFLAILTIPVLAGIAFAQAKPSPAASKTPPPSTTDHVRSSPAYAELLLRKTELQAEMESLLVEYTDEYPKIKEARFELAALQKDIDRILAVKQADASRLTQALGKLILRKIELETGLWALRAKYNDEHPDVKRAKRKLEIYEASIKEILG
jgi:uncharacterized protein involved in exopolysaccharide biosynthesis